MHSTNRQMAVGAAWMVGLQLTVRSLSLISTVILARLLVPADFGIVAMAMSIIAVLELLKAFSFDVTIIQRHDVGRKHFDTAWTFNLLFGLAVSILIVLLAQPTAAFYQESNLGPVMYALAGGWFVSSFENIGTVNFRRDLEFHKEYRFMTLKKFSAFIVTVPLAFWLRSYWALVIGMIGGRLLSVVISYWMHPYRPRLSFTAARDLFGFSAWLLVHNIIRAVNERGSDFVIGRLTGTGGLGVYNLSFELSNMPSTQVAAPINRAILPGYSKIVRDKGALSQSFLDTVAIMALFSVPAGVGIAAIAGPLVTVLLGSKWLEAIPLVQVLGFYGAIASVGTNTSSAFLALGRPKFLTILAVARLSLLLPALIFAVRAMGILGAAWAMLGVAAILAPVNFLVLLPVLHIRFRAFLACIWRPIIASAGMYWLVGEAIGYASQSEMSSPALALVAGISAGLIGYPVIIAILWRLSGLPEGAESIAMNQIRAIMTKSGTRDREGNI